MRAARSSLPGPRPGTLLWGVGWREVDTAPAPHPAPLDSVGGSRRKGRRKGERKGGKFQEPGLEQNKESVFLPFHQQTSTQKEVKKKNPNPPTPRDGWDQEAGAGRPSLAWHVRRPRGLQ